MKRIMLAFGTRPEAIKLCPLVRELKKRGEADVAVTVSGQHRELLESAMHSFGVKAEYELDVMREGQTLSSLTSAVLTGISEVLVSDTPDILLVHGDTATAFAASLAAFYLGIPTGHVEAGLRSGDILHPFPEELNRRAIALTASLHFAPTEEARNNLLAEGVRASRIFVTGNTVVDALGCTVRDTFTHALLSGTQGKRIIFFTAHRRESIGKPLENMLTAVKRLAENISDIEIIYPVHPNPRVRELAHRVLGECERIKLCEPLDVEACHNIIARSYLVLTDSGGLQEEAAALGVPALVMRNVTERKEGIRAGVARLVGTECEKIYDEAKRLLENASEYKKMIAPVNPYGDGHACERIADIICNWDVLSG